MAGKYWGHRFKKYQHNKRHFNEPMQATVYIFRHRTCCFLQINQFYVRWFGSFGWWILYTVNILDTIRHLPCLCWMFRHLGCSAPLPKTADPQLDIDSGNTPKLPPIHLICGLIIIKCRLPVVPVLSICGFVSNVSESLYKIVCLFTMLSSKGKYQNKHTRYPLTAMKMLMTRTLSC